MKAIKILENFVFIESIQLLKTLSPLTHAAWGNMGAQQMIEHLTITVNVSNGKIKLEQITPENKVEKTKNILLLSDRAMPKFFHNPALPEEPIPCECNSINEAILSLKSALEFFEIQFNQEKQTTQLHNIFGELNYSEWLWFHFKHFHHHLSQFKLIPYVDKF